MTAERVETAGEYTPTTAAVRLAARRGDLTGEQFDHWLDRVRVTVYALGGRDALTAAADEIDVAHVARGNYRVPPDYRPRYGAHVQWLDFDTKPPTMHAIGLGDWLRARAAQIGADQ